MKVQTSDFIILIIVGIVLLFLDRYFRINKIIDSFENPLRCGVDLPPCAFGKRCMNGYCVSDSVPTLKPTMLPVFP
jgi:hypothetical protein